MVESTELKEESRARLRIYRAGSTMKLTECLVL